MDNILGRDFRLFFICIFACSISFSSGFYVFQIGKIGVEFFGNASFGDIVVSMAIFSPVIALILSMFSVIFNFYNKNEIPKIITFYTTFNFGNRIFFVFVLLFFIAFAISEQYVNFPLSGIFSAAFCLLFFIESSFHVYKHFQEFDDIPLKGSVMSLCFIFLLGYNIGIVFYNRNSSNVCDLLLKDGQIFGVKIIRFDDKRLLGIFGGRTLVVFSDQIKQIRCGKFGK